MPNATRRCDLTGRPTAALVPGAEPVVYPGAPHGLCVSHPERLNAELPRFIGDGRHV